MQSKKVILLIVEGITDEISLGNIVKKLNKNDKIFFQVVNKDITSDKGSNVSNIITKINEQIELCVSIQHFKLSDIIQIVHIVDTDGAFIEDKYIEYSDVENVEYYEDKIVTKDVEGIKRRNKKKSSILNKLISKKEIHEIPYNIYFFSTNLEHVLHDIQNAKPQQKNELADFFQECFYDNPEQFLEFIKDYTIAGTYEDTWEYIKQGNNSLKRYTNFNLFFE